MDRDWRPSTWGQEISLEYGKALRGHETARGPIRVFGANGPIGWTSQPLAQGPGVILGRKGAYRGVQFSPDPFFVIDTAYYVRPKNELDMRWLYYAIKYHELGAIDDGSPIPSTTRAAVYVREVDVPPIEEQRAIGRVLSALDDKIELNRRMIETLEAMARALFKSWFVDFDPVRAKADGRDPGLLEPIAYLFPAGFIDSELGEIPEGWAVCSVYSIADVVYGAPFSSAQFNTAGVGFPLLRIRDLTTENPGIWTSEAMPTAYKVRPGDIVVGMDGEFRAYIWGGPESWLNQRVCVFIPKSYYSAAFVRNSILKLLADVEATEIGTTVIHLGKADIDHFIVVVPAAAVNVAFNNVCQPLFDRIVTSKRELHALAALRDSLLPKLMSGELRIGGIGALIDGKT